MTLATRICVLTLIASACASGPAPTPSAPSPVVAPQEAQEPDYQALHKASFERAAREHRIIVLSVQAAWCHWCHVMNLQTLGDPEVLALLAERFLVIRVDADARPDIATRYAAWGWPATALLTPDAHSIVNLRGYQAKAAFLALLRELVARQDRGDPLASPAGVALVEAPRSEVRAADLRALREQARAQIARSYDPELHGYGGPKKYPHVAPIEAALIASAFEDQPAMRRAALASLERYAVLIDPVDGGMYQYSVWNGWDAPHYEKIHSVQADALRGYADAARVGDDTGSLERAWSIAQYVLKTLRGPSGAFFANQDADLGHAGEPGHMTGAAYYALDAARRRAAGTPRVDTSVYASYNGLSIAALCALYEASEDESVLEAARRAFETIERSHRSGVLYRHGEQPDDIFHLSDQVEMGYALLALYAATGERAFRERLAELLEATRAALFDAERGVFVSHTAHEDAVGVLATPLISLEDNARSARLLLRAGAVLYDEALREQGRAVLRSLTPYASELLVPSPTPKAKGLVALRQGAGDYLLALETALAPYAVLTVVGPREDARTDALLASARRFYHPTRLIRHDAPGEGKYPYPGTPVIYLCNDNACSMPVSDPARVDAAANAFIAGQRQEQEPQAR